MREITEAEERAALAFIERANEFRVPDLETLHPEVELITVDGVGGHKATFHGRRGVREWVGDPAVSAWSEMRVHADDVRRVEGRLVVLGRITHRARHTGLGFESPFAIVFTFADGLIARIEAHMSHEEGLAVEG